MTRKVSGLIAVGAAVSALGLASAALAAPSAPFTSEVAGSTATGSHKFFATSDNNGISFSVKRTSDGTITPMTCGDVNAEGFVYSGNPLADDIIATIEPVTRVNTPETFSGTDWKDCVGPVGLPMTVSVSNYPWEVHAIDGNTSGSSDTISGAVTGPNGGNVQALVSSGSSSCEFTVEGIAEGSFEESTQALSVNEVGYSGNLTVTDVAGTGTSTCFGLVNVGDVADFHGDFQLGPDVAGNSKSGITQTFPVNVS